MSKLCNKLETKPDTTTGNKTGNKRSLDYSNAKIEKFSPTFGTENFFGNLTSNLRVLGYLYSLDYLNLGLRKWLKDSLA